VKRPVVREYGASGPRVVLVHGGPGAPGYLEPVAWRLAASCRVTEPWQRGSGRERLTVARHVEDLHDLIERSGERPAVVGHSWGAMLALCHAAAYPGDAASLVLVACGTFDRDSRAALAARIAERTDADLAQRLRELPRRVPHPDERLAALGELLLPAYSFEPTTRRLSCGPADARAHDETWSDMLRLQEAGVYPAAFSAIEAPVLMLHGADDPHPGRQILASLTPYLPAIDYREWERCGHYPWLEAHACDAFFAVLDAWLRGEGRAEAPRSS
jgi:pimeloyl-ACP methyl ester carboxylesterase